MMSKCFSDYEPDPIQNDLPAVWGLVVNDMAERDQFGERKYGARLQPGNGRNALVDFYQEQLDGVAYARQLIEEMKCVSKTLASIRNALAEAEYLEKEDCARLAGLLTQILEKNPVLSAE